MPVVMSIAGADCSAGAGIQADLKTFQALSVFGTTAITCVVAETPHEVLRIFPMPVDLLEDQINLLLRSFPISAIKLGMLYSAEHIEAIGRILRAHRSIPLVIDPVLSASTGTPLSTASAVNAYRSHLFPYATLMTPNLPEAQAILDETSSDHVIDRKQAQRILTAIAERYGCSVLLKGGHFNDQTSSPDWLCESGQITVISGTRIHSAASHGTGCTLSAAIAAELAKGYNLLKACQNAKAFVRAAIENGRTWTNCNGESISMMISPRSPR